MSVEQTVAPWTWTVQSVSYKMTLLLVSADASWLLNYVSLFISRRWLSQDPPVMPYIRKWAVFTRKLVKERFHRVSYHTNVGALSTRTKDHHSPRSWAVSISFPKVRKISVAYNLYSHTRHLTKFKFNGFWLCCSYLNSLIDHHCWSLFIPNPTRDIWERVGKIT